MELDVTWKRAIRVWWAYLWRSLIVVIVGSVLAGIVGGIIGFIMSMMGADGDSISMLVMPIGMLIGILISIVPIKLILGKDFGEFRLVLIQSAPDNKV